MIDPIDIYEVFAQTDVEMERLAWTFQQGREFLIETYGKRGRTLLTQEELLDFLRYLKYLPTPESNLENPTPSKVNPLNQNSPNQNKTVRAITKILKKTQSIDLSEVIAQTDVEMERLGWTPQQGREYLINTYGKRGRTLLTQEELLDFLQHLESIPTPEF